MGGSRGTEDITTYVWCCRFPTGDSLERDSFIQVQTPPYKEKGNPEQVLEDKDSLKGRRFYVTDFCAKGLRRLAFQVRSGGIFVQIAADSKAT